MVALNGYIVAALALFAASLTEAAAVPRSAPWSSSLSTKVLIKRGTKQEQVIEKPNFYALSGGPGSVKYAVPPPPVEEPRPHTNQRAEFQHASVAQPIEWHADRTPSALYGSSHEPARHETQEVVGGGLRGGYGHSDRCIRALLPTGTSLDAPSVWWTSEFGCDRTADHVTVWRKSI
ncbi:uncharacterized protein SPPG_07614 [Spizellomyces punctatus DAOM BR117]|uniref:Uncharacterized protein n=1 Tax=Spizellomyces punctatus (strain DAOM BR117) TaxID=645134 RepID=A0A0L0H7N1_SPIPD|nr:uncharacterized protein SPPG_07614 [Spizellomyces punctatus DAOM BR117]KNC97227.1 hypothetical protein SPPG_07614 [Spizellomyces punctatus DAOM BR117]|eukprot:XP_016605267.1 hypothetical protein SPPG_07614 [Spizellomyces punctatus DAOM BR117]